MDLKEIIRGCKNRDRKSREELYLHTADDVMNICIRYTVDKSSAKDIFQDTYLKIFNAIESYDENKGAIGGWIARITVNTALTYLKKQSRIDLKDTFLSDIEPITNEDPIADLSAKEIFAQVASLPDGYRVIFNLFVVEGYSHKEISELLQITPSTSRSQLARAKSLLKKNRLVRRLLIERNVANFILYAAKNASIPKGTVRLFNKVQDKIWSL